MSSPKELGAKQMFEQSLIYLYNSYREEGIPKEEARRLVTEHIESVHEKYADGKVVMSGSKTIVNPMRWIDEIIKDIQSFNWIKWHSAHPKSQASMIRSSLSSIEKKLERLKSILQ